MQADDIVVSLVALWGGELVERIRLHKAAYLLHRGGANFDLYFVYHDYGPYCFKLAAGCADAIEDRRLEVEERRGLHGRYRVFKTKEKHSSIGALSANDARRVVKKLKSATDLVLEIAATIIFLRDEAGYPKMEDAIAATRIRKVQKATEERMKKALSLLCSLGLVRENALELLADRTMRRRPVSATNKPKTSITRLAPLGEFCEIDRRAAGAGELSAAHLPFVGLEHVGAGTGILNLDARSRSGDRKSAAFLFDERHVLYAKLRPYLNKVAIPEFAGCCSTELVPLLPREGVDRDFLAYLLRRKETVDFVMASVTGARMPRTDMRALMSMQAPFPSLGEQKRIAGVLNRVARIEALHLQAADTASALNASLMSRLLERSP